MSYLKRCAHIEMPPPINDLFSVFQSKESKSRRKTARLPAKEMFADHLVKDRLGSRFELRSWSARSTCFLGKDRLRWGTQLEAAYLLFHLPIGAQRRVGFAGRDSTEAEFDAFLSATEREGTHHGTKRETSRVLLSFHSQIWVD